MEEEVEGNDNMRMYERRRIPQSGVQNQNIDRPISTKKLEKGGCVVVPVGIPCGKYACPSRKVQYAAH
ncbi:hypothetical protein GOBAR_DD36256 [Gossypium barbadense]|nr:hypothetical protein GOBAR_DD36256 [Gossypium barbadense]